MFVVIPDKPWLAVGGMAHSKRVSHRPQLDDS